jgi:iron complex outermembrane receptor protein
MFKLKFFSILILILVKVIPLFSQNHSGKISGLVVDSLKNTPIDFANVQLLKDTAVLTSQFTIQDGTFSFAGFPSGKYTLKISIVGYENQISYIDFNTKNKDYVGKYSLVAKSHLLNEVQVLGEKALVESLIDRKVFNVDKLILSPSESALNVLKNIPSVDVDMNGIVSIRQNSQVQILIDGRPSTLSAKSLLEQIPANTISRIEVVTNPNSKYDAAGTGGIINIIQKRNRKAGYNGNVNVGVGARQKYNTGFALNYNTAKLNFASNYSYRYWELTNDLGFFSTNLRPDTTFFYDLKTRWMSKQHTNHINTALDYEINKMNKLSVSGTFDYMKQFSPEDLENRILDENQIVSQLYQRKMRQQETTPAFSGELNYRRFFKVAGQELTAGANYSSSLNSSTLKYDTRDYNPNYVPLATPPRKEEHFPLNGSQFFSVQTDYVHPFSKGKKLEVGFKSTMRNLDNELLAKIYNYQTNNFEIDKIRTNRFLYKEQINALYAIFGGEIKNVQYRFGNRIEHTSLNTNQLAIIRDTNQVYFSYFPSFYLLKKLKNSQQVQFAYSKRINRPSISQLNPVTNFPDTLFLGRGNPNLQPEYVQSFETGYSKNCDKVYLGSTFYYRRSSNLITGITIQQENGVSVTVPQNIKSTQSYGLEFTGNYKLSDKIGFNGSANIFQRVVNAGNINADFMNTSLSWVARLNSNVKLTKAAEMQFNYNYVSRMVVAQASNAPSYGIDGSFRLSVLNKQGSFTASVSDIFNTLQYSQFSFGDNFTNTSLYKGESRVINLSMSYKFGKVKKAHEAIRTNDPNNTGRPYEDLY